MKQLALMVVVISEKICGFYVHPSKKNDHNEALEAFLIMNSKTLTLGDETSKVIWEPMDNLVPQLSRVVTFSYNFHIRHLISHWKGVIKNYTLCRQTLTRLII